MNVLLTGGTGYIGSHAALAVLAAGHEPVLLDDYSNSRPEVVDRLSEIAGRPFTAIRGDVRDADLLTSVLTSHDIEAVIHFAARKSVAESVAQPIAYYSNNVGDCSHCSKPWTPPECGTSCSAAAPRSTAFPKPFRSRRTTRSGR